MGRIAGEGCPLALPGVRACSAKYLQAEHLPAAASRTTLGLGLLPKLLAYQE